MFIIMTDHEHAKEGLFCNFIFAVFSFFYGILQLELKEPKIKFKYRHTIEMLLFNFQ